MAVVLNILLLILLWWLLVYRKVARVTAMAMGILVLIKTIAGYLLTGYFLRHYGGGDMHGYMGDTLVLHSYFLQDPVQFFRLIFLGDETGQDAPVVLSKLKIWYDSEFHTGYNDAQTVTRFHALLSLMTGGNLWLHLMWSNFLCVVGLKWIIVFFRNETKDKEIPWWWWLPALLPNVLIWTSAILKEPLLIFIMGCLFHSTRLLSGKRTLGNIVFFLVSLIGFSMLKYFLLLILLPGIVAVLLFRRRHESGWKMILVYAGCFLLVFIAGQLLPAAHLPSILYGQQRNMWRFAVFMHAGSLLDPVPFAPTDWSFIRHLPYAFIYSLVQPLPAQVTSSVMWPMFLESIFVSALLLIALIFWIRSRKGNLFLTSFAIIAGISILIISGMTTPVLGTLVRYRMPGLLLLVLASIKIISEGQKKDTLPE